MLLNFRVANFRSINEMVELSMVPNDLKNQVNVIHRTNPNATKNKDYYGLTSAAIYGANASGKSNIVNALFDFQDFVLNSTENKPNERIKLYKPFKFNVENTNKPSFFSVDLIVKNVFYTYSTEILHNEIISESLYYFPKGLKVKIFDRSANEIEKGNGYVGVFDLISKRTNANQLFLGKAALENIDIIKNVYNYFNFIEVFTTNIFHSNDFNERFGSFIFNEMGVEKEILRLSRVLLQKIDTQVIDFEFKEGLIKTFHFDNKKNRVEFNFEDESSGTQRVISFLPMILLSLKQGITLVVDEFERSLHPDIAQYILSLFNDPKVNKNGAQFIFATHDTTLLSPENKLRRDQINLVEKNAQGETELYSVSDIKGIREGNYEKWYLEGRFGAVPNIARETFRHELIDFINS